MGKIFYFDEDRAKKKRKKGEVVVKSKLKNKRTVFKIKKRKK